MGHTLGKEEGLVRNASAIPRTLREHSWCAITAEVSIFNGVTGTHRLSIKAHFLAHSSDICLMTDRHAKEESYHSTHEEFYYILFFTIL